MSSRRESSVFIRWSMCSRRLVSCPSCSFIRVSYLSISASIRIIFSRSCSSYVNSDLYLGSREAPRVAPGADIANSNPNTAQARCMTLLGRGAENRLKVRQSSELYNVRIQTRSPKI
ncbi:hypothetical protein DPMN_181965 [Dreissena polymorpha]|uniref:Uncharacterized protein n=1 Tax=Dreissena polymorpha TaxID=45954 RepID=A0A9D4DEZ9_DREPO|nr:hypothetical protein DPMN_181965 [Dreissena polymorpha]